MRAVLINRYKKSIIQLWKDVRVFQADPFQNVMLCLSIQERTISCIYRIESRIRTLKRAISQANPQEADQICGEIQSYQLARRIFCEIGDGLILTFIDRWDLKPLSENNNPGFISGKEGFREELATVKKLSKIGVIAILADITNSLRLGDVWAFKANGESSIFELGGTSGSRKRRQKKRNEQVLEYLRTDRSEVIAKNAIKIRSEPSESPRYFINEIQSLIAKAYLYGSAIEEVEPGLTFVIDLNGRSDISAVLAKYKKPFYLFLNQHKAAIPFYYPLYLSIDNDEAVFNFFTGKLLITSFFDCERIIKYFEEKDFEVKFEGEQSPFLFTARPYDPKLRSDKAFLSISNSLLLRSAMEFLSFEWVLNTSLAKANKIFTGSNAANAV